MQKEFDQMKQRVTREDGPLVVKFRLQFDSAQKGISALIDTMKEIGSADEDKGNKAYSAIKALLHKVIEELK